MSTLRFSIRQFTRPRVAAAALALGLGVPVASVFVNPPKSHAFTLIEQPVFLDPIDLAVGEVARVRLTNLFGSDTIHAVIQIRNAEDSSVLSTLDQYVPPGQGIVQDLPFNALLPAIQRGHAGLIAVATLSSPSAATPSDVASQVAFSAQTVQWGDGRVLAVLSDRHIAPAITGR
ncbi:MAG TPA: hypothetical protein VFA04_10685 [Bryobacteraceae bacterium]|nr:hypothetical protein [Bryobacteraceae bacterium]